MRRWMSFVAAVVCFFTPLACRPTVAHGDAKGDARRDMQGIWRFELRPIAPTERDGAVPFQEALLVDGDRMTPQTFALYGFNPGTVVFRADDAHLFDSTMTSNTKGTLTWTGRVSRDAVVGSVLWLKPDGAKWKYRYVAKRADE